MHYMIIGFVTSDFISSSFFSSLKQNMYIFCKPLGMKMEGNLFFLKTLQVFMWPIILYDKSRPILWF